MQRYRYIFELPSFFYSIYISIAAGLILPITLGVVSSCLSNKGKETINSRVSPGTGVYHLPVYSIEINKTGGTDAYISRFLSGQAEDIRHIFSFFYSMEMNEVDKRHLGLQSSYIRSGLTYFTAFGKTGKLIRRAVTAHIILSCIRTVVLLN